jgi:hypothetical protein
MCFLLCQENLFNAWSELAVRENFPLVVVGSGFDRGRKLEQLTETSFMGIYNELSSEYLQSPDHNTS